MQRLAKWTPWMISINAGLAYNKTQIEKWFTKNSLRYLLQVKQLNMEVEKERLWLSSIHIIGDTKEYNASRQRTDAIPHKTESWKNYILHILTIAVIIEGIVIFNIYKNLYIEEHNLRFIIFICGTLYAMAFVKFFIEIVVNRRFNVMEDEVIDYIINNKPEIVKTKLSSTAYEEKNQRVQLYFPKN